MSSTPSDGLAEERNDARRLSPVMSAITNVYAAVPVADLDAGMDWYTRLFGRPPDTKVPDPDGNAIAFAELPDAA
jgi:hypothetical protein